MISQPRLQLVDHIVPRGGIDPLVPERLLCLTDIMLGELRAHKPSEVVRLDMNKSERCSRGARLAAAFRSSGDDRTATPESRSP